MLQVLLLLLLPSASVSDPSVSAADVVVAFPTYGSVAGDAHNRYALVRGSRSWRFGLRSYVCTNQTYWKDEREARMPPREATWAIPQFMENFQCEPKLTRDPMHMHAAWARNAS